MKALHHLIRYCGVLRVLQLALGCIALCTTVAAQAAEERPPEDDWFTVYFVEGYGFLVVFVIAVIALLIFRILRSRRAGDPLLAKAALGLKFSPSPGVVRIPGMPEDIRTGLLEVLYKLDNIPAVV